MKKAKFGTDFQNNRANYWLYEKYSFDLHPEISKNPDKLLWPEITDVAKTDCRNLHEPAMKDKYIDLIEQTFDFPQDEFSVEDNELNFHDIPLMELIKQFVPLIVPIPFSFYFDIFDGLLQAYVFVFLTALFMTEEME